MKMTAAFWAIFLVVSCASGKEQVYTGSTPADPVVRSFLGIPLSDSVDFIRWKCILRDSHYQLQCNYGIGKANTNGFIKGGLKIELQGAYRRDNNYILLQNRSRTLKALALNEDLLYLLDTDNSLLAGNAGWSYTLNSTTPLGSGRVSITAAPSKLPDSMVFEGRTPCKVPGIIPPGSSCYKIKWQVFLYPKAQMHTPGNYKIMATSWRKEGGRTGIWKIITGKNGRTIYQLNDAQGKGLLYLLKLDEHILAFTDAQGKPLVGDEDFSYTLNRKR